MEIKFKILVLRILMMILYRLYVPNKGTGTESDLDSVAAETHIFIGKLDGMSKEGERQLAIQRKATAAETKSQAKSGPFQLQEA